VLCIIQHKIIFVSGGNSPFFIRLIRKKRKIIQNSWRELWRQKKS